MDLTRLDELKQMLLNDKDLSPVWKFFLDNFVDQPGFMGLGQPVIEEFLNNILGQVSRALYPSNTVISGIHLFHLQEQRFTHGGFFMGGRVGGLFYFEEVETGLLVVCEKPPSIEVKYARFRAQPLRPKPQPSAN